MVALISIDGVRPDGIRLAPTPNLDRLVRDGSVSWEAQSVTPSITLPCHQSMFRSVAPMKHGVLNNELRVGPNVPPSIFDVAARSGQQTAMFGNWSPLRDLGDPEHIHVCYLNNNAHTADGDSHVAEMAIRGAAAEEFDFLFLYLGHTDWVGHEYGWMSDEYLQAISQVDSCVGRFVDALIALHHPVDFIIASDHGGHDKVHGTEEPEDMTVPFIMWGYRCTTGHKIQQPVTLLDVAPTVTRLMGISAPKVWEGRAVLEGIKDTTESERFRQHQVYGLEEESD
ncbi:MAG: alkaline phosphatase family protein [Armatimonadetes bacterium]|nr:alkaline phosphatase family protein [Armatimonadota bacterium]